MGEAKARADAEAREQAAMERRRTLAKLIAACFQQACPDVLLASSCAVKAVAAIEPHLKGLLVTVADEGHHNGVEIAGAEVGLMRDDTYVFITSPMPVTMIPLRPETAEAFATRLFELSQELFAAQGRALEGAEHEHGHDERGRADAAPDADGAGNAEAAHLGDRKVGGGEGGQKH